MIGKEVEGCPLCGREELTPWLYEDDVCWAAYCVSHPDKIIVVLNRHTDTPTDEEMTYLEDTARMLSNKEFRDPHSILEHFHLHEA